MAVLPGHFSLFRKRIEPDAEKATVAQDLPAKVRDHLRKHPEFATQDPHTRLAGSYARRTATKQIKDVDILVFVAQSWRDETIPDMMQALYDALKELPETLEDGDEPELRRQRRSVGVYLPKSDISLDIVPVLKTGTSLDEVLEVPDKEWDEWVFTHPLGYGCLLSELNSDNSGKIVPTVKMVKHWRDIKFQRMRPKSYWLESMVVRHIRRGWVTTTGKGDGAILADLFDSIYERFKPVLDREEETPFIPDAKLRNPVAWNWKRTAFETFMRRLDETCTLARTAVDTSDDEIAVACWKQIFGDEWFPSTTEVEEEYKKLKALSTSGLLVVTSVGRVLTERPAQAVSIPSPPKRFFGGV